jgi:hypothetical protein
MPRPLNDDEMGLLLDLAQPIEPRQRDQFLREVTDALEATAERTGVGPGPGGVHRVGGAIQRRYRGSPQLGDDD